MQPIITMNHIIRMKLCNDLIVHHIILYYDIAYLWNVFYKLNSFLKTHCWEAIETDHCSITKHAYYDFPIFSCFMNNI